MRCGTDEGGLEESKASERFEACCMKTGGLQKGGDS